MIMIDKIKEYIKCPQFGDLEYGEWGALRLEQREAYKYLIDIIEWQEHEISRLTSLIKEIAVCFDEESPEEPKGIPEKIDHLIGYDIRQFDDLKECVEITTNDLFGKVNKITDILNQVLDYLESKGK